MKYNINLLSRKDLSFFDKAVYFSLNYLRYILVITQLVVIGVLFFRFKIDNDIIELKEAIAQKQEIIKVTQPLVDEARRLDLQVAAVKDSGGKQNVLKNALLYITSVFPQRLFLTELTIENGVYRMKGTSPDVSTVQRFYTRLQREGRFGAVNLEDLNREEGGVRFTLTLGNFKSS